MIHLKHAAPASGAVMRAIWFPSFTFLAETALAGRLYGEGWSISVRRRLVGRKVRVAYFTARLERGSWVSEDGGGVCPVQEKVENNANNGGNCTCNPMILAEDTVGNQRESVLTRPFIVTGRESYSCLHPNCPCTQAIDEGQGKVRDNGTTGALASPCPTFMATVHRGR